MTAARSRLSVATLLELAAALDIICRKPDGSCVLYFRPPKDDTLQEYQHRKLFSLAQERARLLSVMQDIPEAAAALLAIAPLCADAPPADITRTRSALVVRPEPGVKRLPSV